MHRYLFIATIVGIGSAFASGPAVSCAEETLTAESRIDGESPEMRFVRETLPILRTKCLACHGDDPDDLRGELDLRTREATLRGGESGEPSVVVGESLESPLYLAATRTDAIYSAMPPKENDALSADQLAALKRWIDDGAVWPDAARIATLQLELERWDVGDGVRVSTSGGLANDWTNRRYDPENLWAYRPLPDSVPVPDVPDAKSPIDAFLAARMDELGIVPAPLVDRRTLIRRATFDLTGLPPTPEETQAILSDPASDLDAFATVVDRLLASPHFGERQARHWLDVVRYADSSGYANDYERGSAWRYRDYVVRAFNDDKPYDRFVLEQIAGDELAAENPQDDDAISEAIVAAGFLRMGPWELTGMEVEKVARQRFLDDVTDAVGQVFLGHMLQCARCHDHKFDPIPTRDYYSIQAAFATTQLAERPAAFLESENVSGFDEKAYLIQRERMYRDELKALDAKQTVPAARRWYGENEVDASAFEAVVAKMTAESKTDEESLRFDAVRTRMQDDGVDPALIFPKGAGFEPVDYGRERIARKGLERLEWRMERYEPVALSVYAGRTPTLRSVNRPLRIPKDPLKRGELEATCILVGGDPFASGRAVQPGVLSAVVGMTADDRRDVSIFADEAPKDYGSIDATLPLEGEAIAGRRLALARWIVSEENPLTPRVMANRIWQSHFGRGIAGNPNNFGATGKRPTHPELLDWLARTFVDGGWSVKALHREILLSQAYRRSTTPTDPAALARLDPDGASYAAFRPRRLSAEELRDAMLAVSGELNPEVGGIPVRPEMNSEAAFQPRQVMGTFAEVWQPSPLPSQRHRRSLYSLQIRGLRDPFFEVFNSPSPDLSCEARESSTVAPQAFSLFNGEASYARSLAFARRLLTEASIADDADGLSDSRRSAVLDRAFRLAYARPATKEELAACDEHWAGMTKRHRSLEFEARPIRTEIEREAVEENTGEKFTFVEPLEFSADYVPDREPSEASPLERGLAEVCLVLFNANEFVYLD